MFRCIQSIAAAGCGAPSGSDTESDSPEDHGSLDSRNGGGQQKRHGRQQRQPKQQQHISTGASNGQACGAPAATAAAETAAAGTIKQQLQQLGAPPDNFDSRSSNIKVVRILTATGGAASDADRSSNKSSHRRHATGSNTSSNGCDLGKTSRAAAAVATAAGRQQADKGEPVPVPILRALAVTAATTERALISAATARRVMHQPVMAAEPFVVALQMASWEEVPEVLRSFQQELQRSQRQRGIQVLRTAMVAAPPAKHK